MEVGLPNRVRFGAFELDPKAGELRKGARKVLLQGQPFQILLMLIERRGDLVTLEEIKKTLWPNDTVVEFDHSIYTAIKKLRQALGDPADNPKYVETVARRGYRLIMPVESEGDSSSDSALVEAEENSSTPSAPVEASQPRVGDLLGKKVSHYRVLEIIGGGGMGLVYKAEDLKLGRRVALKFLPQELASDPVSLQRFEREARTASSLNHPNICTIYAVEEHGGQPFIAMELLEGETLRDRLAADSQAIPLDELLKIALQVGEGLEAAHELGIIHRDIKPANIFLTNRGTAKILDFGLAKLEKTRERSEEARSTTSAAEDSSSGSVKPEGDTSQGWTSLGMVAELTLTGTGAAMGTAGYMSPEQVRGEQLDPRTDLFSFGLVLYEMATGMRAFTAETAALLKDLILNDSAAPVRQLNVKVPLRLEQIIDKAIEKDREKRYQSAAAMRADLEAMNPDQGRFFHWQLPRWILPVVATAIVSVAVGMYWHSHRRTKLGQQDSIVLADFANSAGDIVFDGTLKQALTMELAQSPFLNVLSDEKIAHTLKLMNRQPGERLTPATARELCLRTDGKAVVESSIAMRDQHYALEARVVDCHTGDALANARADAADRSKVLIALDKIGDQLRQRMGESLDSVQKYDLPLEQATTSSLEALQAYTQGGLQQSQKGDAAAVPYYKLAVDLDPKFAYAYAALGQAHFTLYEVGLALENFRKTFALRERISRRERFYIEGVYYSMAGDLDSTIKTYEEWAKAYPRDYQAHNDLSRRLRSAGQYERAASEARQALALSRDSASAYSSLMLASIRLNRLHEAKAAFDEAQTRRLDGTYLHLARYQVAFLEGDDRGMAEQVAAENGKPGMADILLHAQADTESYYGRFRRSREFSDLAVEKAQDAGAPERAAIYKTWQALQEVEVGASDRARRTAVAALALSKGDYVMAKAALALARTGDWKRAQRLTEQVNQELPEETLEQNYSLPAIRAAIELGRSRPGKAIEVLKPTLPYDLGAGSICCMVPAYLRGIAYLQLRQGERAAIEFNKVLQHPGTSVNFVTGALAHLQLGRAQAMTGDRAAARKSYQDFLTLWKDADPDIPIYSQAKTEYAKLR